MELMLLKLHSNLVIKIIHKWLFIIIVFIHQILFTKSLQPLKHSTSRLLIYSFALLLNITIKSLSNQKSEGSEAASAHPYGFPIVSKVYLSLTLCFYQSISYFHIYKLSKLCIYKKDYYAYFQNQQNKKNFNVELNSF